MSYDENTNAQKHGGEAAVTDIKHGTPLRGLAKEAEELVKDELANIGRVEIVTNAAIRLEAVSRLYYNALLDAAAKNDLRKLDTYVKRFGWLQSAALRAWAQVKQEEKDLPNTLDYEMMLQNENGDK